MSVVDLFAGPGGADEGLRMAGVTDVLGIEWDDDACDTAVAAGHERVQEDVAALDPQDFPCDGLWASPPCQAWSMAGKRAAMADQARLGEHAEACRGGWVPYDPADYADPRTPLVLEPLRWADALRPKWLVCEQVPPVLDLWRHYAAVLRHRGYRAWAGILNAADYGVPQTRQRAFLIAWLDGPPDPPEPTHAKEPQGAGLFGGGRLPWVTMAQALGPTSEPAPTIRAGSKGSGPNLILWQWVNGNQDNSAVRRMDEPAPTVHFGHRTNDVKWVHERPATTIVSGGNRSTSELPNGSSGGGVRVTVQQAAILQGFPPGYPWQGSKTSQFAQVGNAVPPPLAAAICAGLVNAREVAA